jgi:hypothetical protein
MTTTPGNIIPARPEGDEEVSHQPQVKRPAEKVTPSQEGRFLGALEKKGPTKEGKKSTGMASSTASADETEEAEEPSSGADVFHLAKAKHVKEQSSFGESPSEEDLPGAQLPVKKSGSEKKLSVATSNTSAEQIAGAQAQAAQLAADASAKAAQVPVGEESKISYAGSSNGSEMEIPPVGQGPAVPSSVIAKETSVQGPAIQKAEPPTVKSKESFQKFMGGEDKKETLAAKEAAAALPREAVSSPVIAQASTPTQATSQAHRAAIMEVIRQAADAIAIFVSKQETTTVVTIKQPPLFAGASITITEYSSAPQQFNITFTNLSPDAQRVIASMANQQQLKQALVAKGYTVQNVFIEATPRPITAPAAPEAAPQRQQQGEMGEEMTDTGTGGSAGGRGGETGGAT